MCDECQSMTMSVLGQEGKRKTSGGIGARAPAEQELKKARQSQVCVVNRS